MSVLSIDVGLKNLAFCVMSAEDPKDLKSYKIDLWNVYDTLDCGDKHICSCLKKNGVICGNKGSYKHENEEKEIVYSCKTHFPKDVVITKQHQVIKKKVDSYLLQDIAKIVICKIQDVYDKEIDIFRKLKTIFIELQPNQNPKMKLVSHLIFGKFCELLKDTDVTIRFVRASAKLKVDYNGPEIVCKLKSAYARRKFLSVEYSKWFLENKFNEEQGKLWLPLLSGKGKTDDLCDTFLMAINALFGIPKKPKTSKPAKTVKKRRFKKIK